MIEKVYSQSDTTEFLKPQKGIGLIDRSSGNSVPEKIAKSTLMKLAHETLAGRKMSLLFAAKIFSVIRGILADIPVSQKTIQKFCRDHGIDLEEAVIPEGGFQTCNEAFTRKLQPEAREIVSDEKTACVPADSVVWAQENINPESVLKVKGRSLELKEILEDKDLAELYRNGTFICCRLRPEDYHHWHAPVTGIPTIPKPISGKLHSVSPLSLRKRVKTWADNKRETYCIDSPQFGKVIVVSVGAMFVGKMEHSFTPGETVKKGEDIGTFHLGGSTILLIFEEGKLELSSDILSNSENGVETICKIGEALGTCPKQENLPKSE